MTFSLQSSWSLAAAAATRWRGEDVGDRQFIEDVFVVVQVLEVEEKRQEVEASQSPSHLRLTLQLHMF